MVHGIDPVIGCRYSMRTPPGRPFGTFTRRPSVSGGSGRASAESWGATKRGDGGRYQRDIFSDRWSNQGGRLRLGGRDGVA